MEQTEENDIADDEEEERANERKRRTEPETEYSHNHMRLWTLSFPLHKPIFNVQ